ncbi:MAG: hypothetical protein WBM17_14745, partial [Anaerolineales bacterium]
MPKRNWLLIAAVAGLAAFLCMAVGFSVGINLHSTDQLNEERVRRQSVEESMNAILPGEVASVNSPELAQAVERLKSEPYVVWVWVSDPKGDIRLSYNGPAEVGDNVYELSQYEEDLISAVDPQHMDPVTEMELRLAMALRREGEHNDIYSHLVRYIPGPDGQPAAYVGVTFEGVDTSPGILDIVFVILGAVGFGLYWLGLPLWVFLDSRAGGSGRASVLWGLFVLVA